MNFYTAAWKAVIRVAGIGFGLRSDQVTGDTQLWSGIYRMQTHKGLVRVRASEHYREIGKRLAENRIVGFASNLCDL